jgi:hypothetical protein
VYAGKGGIAPARSEPATVTIGEKKPVPVAYTLAAFSATCFALLSFVALRTRPWERLRRRNRDGDDGGLRDASSTPSKEIATGLQPARASLVSSILRAADQGFTGTVVDAITDKPVGFAQIVIEGAGETVRIAAEASGEFAQESLPAGTHSVTVRARGYVASHFSVTIPHRGELRGSQLRLLPVREKVFNMYRSVAEALLPSRQLWGIWTPRQILEHVRKSGALAELTDFVEEIYFSQRVPDETAISRAEELIGAAQAELPAETVSTAGEDAPE